MRIDTLSLKNFQSHKNSVIHLSPGFNLLIGSSNDGKSSIVRSLECLLYGDWDSSYVTIGEKESVISAQLEDSSFIEKTKGKGINKFSIKSATSQSEDYSGFGDNLPIDIIKKLGSHPIILDDDKKLFINIAAQHDSIFLLNESSGLRSKIIGYISGVHLIDSVVRETLSEYRTILSTISTLENDNSQMKAIVLSYESKESEFSKIAELEIEIQHQEELLSEIQKLESIIVSARNYNAKVQDLKNSVNKLSTMDETKIRSKFVDQMIELKQCPFCGSGLEKELVSKHFCNV